jgi:hypothetical protein
MQRTYKSRLCDRPATELSWKARSGRKWLNLHDLQQLAADAARNILAIELNNLKGGGHV